MNRLIARFRRRHITVSARRDRYNDWQPAPGDLLAAEQCLNRMRCALDRASGRTRAIFLMHRLDGLDYAEIGQHMNLTVSAVRAEAAAWVARLHRPDREEAVEASWRRWMNESPSHAEAFELLTETWEKSQGLRRRPLEKLGSWELPGFRIRFSRAALAAVLIAVLAILGTVLYLGTGAR